MQPADKSLHLARILFQEADVVAAHDALGAVERDNPYEVRKQIPNLGIIGGLDVTVMGTGTPGQCVDMAKRAIDELGRTQLRVSEIGLGSGGFEKVIDHRRTQDIIDCAPANGVNCVSWQEHTRLPLSTDAFIDIYNAHPQVRTNIGDALHRHPRESYILQGHFGNIFDRTGQYRRTRLVDEAMWSYEDFLRRMHTDYVDIELLHNCDEADDFASIVDGGLLARAQELKKSGAVGYLGISTHNPAIARKAAELGCLDVILLSLNPAYDMMAPGDDQSAVLQGIRQGGYTGISPARAALYNLCAANGVAITVEELRAALRFCDPAENRDYSSFLASVPSASFRGHCMYCGHCAPCASVIDVAAVNRCVDLAQVQSCVPPTVREHYAQLAHHAEDCVECGACMTRCPFGVDAIKKMQDAKEIFGY